MTRKTRSLKEMDEMPDRMEQVSKFQGFFLYRLRRVEGKCRDFQQPGYLPDRMTFVFPDPD